MTLGQFLREQFVFAGAAGAVPADLYRDYKDSTRRQVTRMPSKLTYHSFTRTIGVLARLGYIERTPRTEASFQKGVATSGVLRDRRFCRFTKLGREVDADAWRYPMRTRYPGLCAYRPTGGTLGRPLRRRVALAVEILTSE